MFEATKTSKVSDQIVEQIRGAILMGQLKPGDKLPPEKELVETFQVSKATLREALRSLEVLGFLEMRKGAAGGAYVVEMEMEKARDYLANFLHFKEMSIDNLTEVRLILESYTSEQAALGISSEDLEKLKQLIDQSEPILEHGTPQEYRQNEIEFHRIIGSVTGNPILMFLLDFVENLLIDTKEILKPGKEFSRRVLAAHQRIYEALVERDGKRARQEMIEHVVQVSEDLIAIQKERGPVDLGLSGRVFLRGLFSEKEVMTKRF